MAGRSRPQPPPAAEAEAPVDGEVAPVARVQRSRLAFAMSATVAALPILVLDNFPATAETGEPTSVVAAGPTEQAALEEPVRVSTSTAAEPTDPTDAPPAEPATTEVAAEPTTTDEPTPDVAAAEPAVQHEAPPSTSSAPAPTPPPEPPTTEAPPARHSPGDPADPATWDRLAQCESGGQWHLNSGNGYYGGLQFSLASWEEVGGAGYPHEASREEQIHRGRLLQARYGWGQWPHCADQLGYR